MPDIFQQIFIPRQTGFIDMSPYFHYILLRKEVQHTEPGGPDF